MKDTDGFYRWKRCFRSFLMGPASSLMNHLDPLLEKKSEGNIHPVTFNRFFFFLKRPPLSKCCLWAPDGHVKHTLWMYDTLCLARWVITKYDMNQLKKYKESSNGSLLVLNKMYLVTPYFSLLQLMRGNDETMSVSEKRKKKKRNVTRCKD